jgi:Ca2+-binding EF-hand superfamily protein
VALQTINCRKLYRHGGLYFPILFCSILALREYLAGSNQMGLRHAAPGLLFALILASDPGFAQTGTPPRDGRQAYRAPDRFLALDSNHDGNITRDEMNRAESQRFSTAAHGRKVMTAGEFGDLAVALSRPRTDALFARLDWNGDGNLSLEEYAAQVRAQFAAFENGSGEESCGNAFRASFGPREFGRERFCDDNDLNRDGKVTRAELDKVLAKTFSMQSGGAKVMTRAQYRAAADGRERSYAVRAFQRLDADGNGQLSLGEFSASDQRVFARLDTNRDGVVTRNELGQARAGF